MASGQSLARPTVNKRINTIRRMFKWGVSEELVPAAVYEALRSVDGLRRGRTNARETPPVVPVDDNDVEKTLVYLPPTVAAMVRVQRLSGMRPGSVTLMRSCDIDRSGGVWIYEPHDHKTKYRDHRLLIPIGPEAQAVLQPFLNRPGNAYLFAPSEAQAWRREQRAARPSTRKSPVYPSERKRVERDKQRRCRRKSKRMPGPRYTTATYYRAVRYGIRAARKAGDDVADWHPNQLRHTRATEVRRDHGVEAAQVVLGHRNAHVTQVYAERDMALACQVAKRSG
jgi:integrase